MNSAMDKVWNNATHWKLVVRHSAFQLLQTWITKSLQAAVGRSKVDDADFVFNAEDEALSKLTGHVRKAVGIFNSAEIIDLIQRMSRFMQASQANALQAALITAISATIVEDAPFDLQDLTPTDLASMINAVRSPFLEAGTDSIKIEASKQAKSVKEVSKQVSQ